MSLWQAFGCKRAAHSAFAIVLLSSPAAADWSLAPLRPNELIAVGATGMEGGQKFVHLACAIGSRSAKIVYQSDWLFSDHMEPANIKIHSKRYGQNELSIKVTGKPISLPSDILGYEIGLDPSDASWLAGILLDQRKVVISIDLPPEIGPAQPETELAIFANGSLYVALAMAEHCGIEPSKISSQ